MEPFEGEYETQGCYCPSCGYHCEMASGTRKGRAPQPGDLSVCLYCATVNMFTDEMTLRKMTVEESEAIPIEMARHLFQVQTAVNAVRNGWTGDIIKQGELEDGGETRDAVEEEWAGDATGDGSGPIESEGGD